MSRWLLHISVFAVVFASAAAVEGLFAPPPGSNSGGDVSGGEASCTSGFTLSGFTDTRLNGDYIAVLSQLDNSITGTYHLDGSSDNAPYGINIRPSQGDQHYVQGKHWKIYFSPWQNWNVLLAWCVPGVDNCPEFSDGERSLWPSAVGLIKWNVVVDPDFDPPFEPPNPPNTTTVNSGVSASCCEYTPDKCLSCKCDQVIPLKATCSWSPLLVPCRKDCCDWVHTGQGDGIFSSWACKKNEIFRHCDHSSETTESSAITKQLEFTA